MNIIHDNKNINTIIIIYYIVVLYIISVKMYQDKSLLLFLTFIQRN